MADVLYFDLVPDPPEGFYYQYCCTWVDFISQHGTGGEATCIAWSAEPPVWQDYLIKTTCTDNGCNIIYNTIQNTVMSQFCTPVGEPLIGFYNYYRRLEIYDLIPCSEPDILFPEIESGFDYTDTWTEYDNEIDCSQFNGKTESALINCLIHYRCKSKKGYIFTSDGETEEWIKDPTYYPYVYTEPNTCCDFVPKNYKTWMNDFYCDGVE